MANPNPSPETRFGGERGNPSGCGKTKEQKRLEMEAAEMSAKMRHKMLSEMMEKAESGQLDLEELLTPAALKLFKDSEDRAHGTPKQSVEADHKSSDGSMTPTFITNYEPKPDE